MQRRQSRSTQSRSSAASDVYKRQGRDRRKRGRGGHQEERDDQRQDADSFHSGPPESIVGIIAVFVQTPEHRKDSKARGVNERERSRRDMDVGQVPRVLSPNSGPAEVPCRLNSADRPDCAFTSLVLECGRFSPLKVVSGWPVVSLPHT